MKKLLLLPLIAISLVATAQTTAISDTIFEQALINLGYDNVIDGGVLTANISGVTTLDLYNNNITDLTGIEAFTALTYLDCSFNGLTSLDVSQNTALTDLRCGLNQLTSIDVTQNIALTTLDFFYNQLTTIDVTQNTALESLICWENQLISLDVSQNTALTELLCGGNQLTSLDLSQNTALSYLGCGHNQLTNLDVSQNTALENLWCHNNNLICLNVANGNNSNFVMFNAIGNPNLTCIEVDDVTYSNNNWSINNGNIELDQPITFSTNCNNSCVPPPPILITAIPDSYFEQRLINLGLDNVIDGGVLTANIDTVTYLDLGSAGISDLTGIEDFTALIGLYCYNNQLTTIDVTQNTALESLSCFENQITTLDVTQNTALIGLDFTRNLLTTIDVTQNTALERLICFENQLISLDVSQNTALDELWCANNQLTSLDVTQNTALVVLRCGINQLTTIDVTQNTALETLVCVNNQLTTLNLSQNTALETLDCGGNQLTTLDLSQNTALTSLWCEDNNLICLNIATGSTLNLSQLLATGNPNLTCIEVDDGWSTSNWVSIDQQTTFSTNCNNSCSVGIKENAVSSLSISPNPTTSTITLNSLQLGDEVSVYNTLGQRVYSSKVSAVTLSINLSELGNNGIYFVRVNNLSERVLLSR